MDCRRFFLPILAFSFLVLLLQVEGRGRLRLGHDRKLASHQRKFASHLRKPLRSCGCNDRRLCMPLPIASLKYPEAPHVQNYLLKKNKTEVFAFVLDCEESVWSKFNWNKLTTIALAGKANTDLICHAHENGVAVVSLENIPKDQLPNATARSAWVNERLMYAMSNSMDGINIDFEDPIDDQSPEMEGLSSLVQETVEAFHKIIPGSQVSYDVAWKAGGIDGRFYDYKAIGEYSDLVFIMAYDEMSQIFDEPCNARANSGLMKAIEGIDSYLQLGIPGNKLVIGVPWYGYRYSCIDFDENETCYIEEVPFRGANCSDAAGSQHPYSYMVETQKEYNATYRWDKETSTPYYTIQDKETGQYIQMRFDDAPSLEYKYALVKEKSLRGVGMWTANFLDYSDTLEAAEQRALMWGIMP
ncbi:di-N-acetylchitobiase-like [Palaemon carinicauda]|uniref:di-N-acetylchitobiase-like n=1 Tax=Palaemon carinicauda TaxID=392227 RepID=UPI0035B60538